MDLRTNGNALELTGSLDVRCTAELRTAVYRLLEAHEGDVRVDLSRVESIDLTTLKMLAVANRSAERQGRRVVLTGGSPGVRRLMHLSHLRSMLHIKPFETVAAQPPPEPPGGRSRAG